MVHLETLREMEKMFTSNLQSYIKDHPGSYVVIESKAGELDATFYNSKKELNHAAAKYRGLIGATYFSQKIPTKTHRFNQNNKTFDCIDEYVTFCPNDNDTKLVLDSGVSSMNHAQKKRYEEQAHCPDCNYQVFRKPSLQRIRSFEKSLEEIIVG